MAERKRREWIVPEGLEQLRKENWVTVKDEKGGTHMVPESMYQRYLEKQKAAEKTEE